MTDTRKHRFSPGAGFGDPYAGFILEFDRDGTRDPFRADPTDSHVFARVAWFVPESRTAVESWMSRGVAHGQLGEYEVAEGIEAVGGGSAGRERLGA